MREPGYYWVRYFGDWVVSEWNGEHWLITGSGLLSRSDEDMDEIDERRIERPSPSDAVDKLDHALRKQGFK